MCHSLRGLCGLKYIGDVIWNGIVLSQPARAVWIEIYPSNDLYPSYDRHSLRGLCGLKYQFRLGRRLHMLSQPARAVWIEIDNVNPFISYCLSHSLRGLCGLKSYVRHPNHAEGYVTACEGCVD